MATEIELTLTGLRNLLSELINGATGDQSWVLNPGDPGLIETLEKLPADVVSQSPARGRNTIAAHAIHVKYGLELLNRWASGEENPFATADWPASWLKQVVTDDEWSDIVAALRHDATAWLAAIDQPRDWDEISLTGTLASSAHLAYHLGAIRQITGVVGSGEEE